ncbi:CynX/NimT family MFS transporter [Hahella ganghwensis]|uniref:MFS transporter n=1 Tax=Hahella ganghwensis TaxID=286420 RepID=UPI000369A82A|nr:MFS transporter [Hahella ganghwensis]
MSESSAPTNSTTPMNGLEKVNIGLVLVLAMALPMLILYATGALGPYLIEALQINKTDLSYFVMASFGLASVLSLFAGKIVDSLGLRSSFALHFLAIAASFLLISMADSLTAMIGAVAIVGLSQAIANPVTNQLIALRIPASSKPKMVGLKQSGVQLSALFAGFALPAIAIHWDWRAAFGVIVPIAMTMAVLGWKIAPKKAAGSKPSNLRPPNVPLTLLMLTQGGIGAVLSAYITYVPSFATSLSFPPEQAALLITLFGITGMASRIIMTPIAASFDNQAMFIVGLTGFAIIAIMITMRASHSDGWPLYFGVTGIGLSIVATNAIAMGMVIKDQRFGPVAYASGMVSAAFFGGLATGSAAFGQIISFFGDFSSGWVFTIMVLAFSGTFCFLLASQHQQLTQQEATSK